MLNAYITFLPMRSARLFDDRHHGIDALLKRRVGWVGHKLVVLDEVNASLGREARRAVRFYEVSGLHWFDDGADQRALKTFVSCRVPSIPNFGPRKTFANDSGTSRSISFQPENCLSS